MRILKTIETDRYEKLGDTGLLTHTGMITGQEAFDQLKAHLESVDMLPEEYFLPSVLENEMDQELPNFHTAICHTDWGGNEGIYIDIWLLGIEPDRTWKPFHLAVGKTLDSSGDAFLRMSRIAAECSIMLNGRGSHIRVPDTAYPAKQSPYVVDVPLSSDTVKDHAGSPLDTRIDTAVSRANLVYDGQQKPDLGR